MADIISRFPDSIICYILSFLPTKQVVATSVLCKRWNLLWRSVISLDFDHQDRTGSFEDELDDCSNFLYSMYSLLLLRDKDKPLHRLRLRCCSTYNHYSIEIWIKAAMRSSRLEHLDLNVYKNFVVPSVVFSCKTLAVLNLANLVLKDVSFVDFLLLKILHLNSICFSGCEDLLKQFLSGSPNLEDLEIKNLDANQAEKFNGLPKLVRANIDAHLVPLENVKNVQVLVTDGIHLQDLVFDFLNLVKLELTSLQSSKQCLQVLEVLKHCPKLQTLFITIFQEKNLVAEDDEETLLPCPDVPTCILLHLKTCCLKNYSGSVFEFQFAEYIMLNANYLRTMKFCIHSDEYSNLLRRHDVIRDLSSCSKSSDACTLSFEKL